MKTKIEIKSIWGSVLFTHESEENTIKRTLTEANLRGANLRGANLRGAYLTEAYLRGANLRGANLTGAYLTGANLTEANLTGANLTGAYLTGAYLTGANLRGANLTGANLTGANLTEANLTGAYLTEANLTEAYLRGAYLTGANLTEANFNEKTAMFLSQCPPEGSFIAWKKAHGKIIKLLVCEDAKRSSATTLKCRCSSVIVLEIQDLEGNRLDQKSITSDRTESFIYTVGEIASVDNFDENRFEECSTGIHFFIAREMAVKY